jgi:hypothetical protein
LPRTEHPFMGLLTRSEYSKQLISWLWLPRSRFAVNFVSVLRSFQLRLMNQQLRKFIHLSSSFAALQGVARTLLVGVSRQPTPSMGFRPLGHMRRARSGSRGVSIPATFRPQGLVTLSTVCSLAGPDDFVSRRQRLWGLTLRSFLLPDGYNGIPAMFAPRVVTTDSHSSIETNEG